MLQSKRIEQFITDTAADPVAALESLQKDLMAAQGPLVEELPGSSCLLVTFVFEASASAGSVRVSCELWPYDLSNTSAFGPELNRIEGTNVWHISVEADPATVIPYQFQIDPPSPGDTLEEAMATFSDEKRLAAWTRGLFASGRSDPYNPDTHYPYTALMGGDPDGTSTRERWESVLALPAADPFPYLEGQPLRGRLERHVVSWQLLPGDRDVSVYLPPGYDTGSDYPLVVLQDGEFMLGSGQIDEAIDGAIARGAIPATVVVFVHNLTIASRMRELACNAVLPEALADDLLPWIRANYRVTTDPQQTVIGGQSYSGLSSAWVAFQRPDAFGAAFIVSPSLWHTPPEAGDVMGEILGGWLTQQYRDAGRKPIRMFVAVGSQERTPYPQGVAAGQSMVDLARHFRDAVSAKGYDVVGYREFAGGHNHLTVCRLLVPALRALFGGATTSDEDLT